MGVEIRNSHDEQRYMSASIAQKLDLARCRGLLDAALNVRGVGQGGDFDKFQRAGTISLEDCAKDKLVHSEGDVLDEVAVTRAVAIIVSDETKSQVFRALKVHSLLSSKWAPLTNFNRARIFEAVYGECELTLAGHAHMENIELLRDLCAKLTSFTFMLGRDRLTHMKQHFNVATQGTDPVDEQICGEFVSDLKGLSCPMYISETNQKIKTSNVDIEYEKLLETGNVMSIWRALNKLPPQRVYRLASKSIPRLSESRLLVFSRLIHFLTMDTITRSHRVTLKLLAGVEDLHGTVTLPVESWQMLEELRVGLSRHYPRVFSMMRLRNALQQSASYVKTRKIDPSMKSIMDSTNTLTDNVPPVTKALTPRFGHGNPRDDVWARAQDSSQLSLSVGKLLQLAHEFDVEKEPDTNPKLKTVFAPKKVTDRPARRSVHYNPSDYFHS